MEGSGTEWCASDGQLSGRSPQPAGQRRELNCSSVCIARTAAKAVSNNINSASTFMVLPAWSAGGGRDDRAPIIGEHGLDPRLDLRGAHRPTAAALRAWGHRGSPEGRGCSHWSCFRRRFWTTRGGHTMMPVFPRHRRCELLHIAGGEVLPHREGFRQSACLSAVSRVLCYSPVGTSGVIPEGGRRQRLGVVCGGRG